MPNRDHCDQGGHFLNHTIRELTTHYAVAHKKSTLYYPQAKGLVESTNKILQMILKKIVNENRTDWDDKLQSAANWIGCSLDEDFEIVNKKHDLG